MTPTLLLILDGYGLAEPGPGNAVTLAQTPTLHRLLAQPGNTKLQASGRAVGLPEGFIGNSEVGHLNIGAGRIVYQDLTRIDMAVENNEMGQMEIFQNLCHAVKNNGGRLHFLGLLSDAGVHSHTNHLYALLDAAKAANVPSLVHAFLDGRDTAPTSGRGFVAELVKRARLASLCGRFYAMDRDKRWERVKEAWDMLVHGEGTLTADPVAFLEESYARGETDEFIRPHLVLPASEATIRNGDGVFFFNYRADRAREMVHALTDKDFAFFERGTVPNVAIATMTSYDATLSLPVMFPKDNLQNTLGEVVSGLGLKQLRIAETEKYAHVTYFFNGGREEPFPGEDRIMVPSPKDVPTYDLKPAMSAEEVTNKLLAAWGTGQYVFAVCNLANPDMVGHTGVLKAAVQALEVVDACVARIEKAVLELGGRMLVTADHGNVEHMLDEDGSPYTAHTTNLTPLISVARPPFALNPATGKLGDIAPTLLKLWNITPPAEMTGNSLV